MKRINLFLVCFFILPFFLHSQSMEDSPEEPREPFHMKDRKFELGLLNASAGFANDFLSAGEIFREKVEIDLDKLDKGFRINLNAGVSPWYFSVNHDDKWGFGLSTKFNATGIIGLSGDLLTFSQAVNDPSDAAGSAFVEASPNAFFYIRDFKVKVKPALFYPIMYIRPGKKANISYTNKTAASSSGGGEETTFNLAYDVKMYTAFSLDPDANSSFSLTSKPGFDISAGVEYPLSKILDLQEIHDILDFDVGLDIISLPFIPGKITDYMRMSGTIGKDEPIKDFFDDSLLEELFNIEETQYGENKIKVLRPFKLLTWAEWRPFEKQTFKFYPSLGFAVNSIYVKKFSMEGGITARMDLANLFIVELGTNYNDRLWRNSLDMAINLRAFELDLGIDMRSQRFGKSFNASGVGANFGLKFGW